MYKTRMMAKALKVFFMTSLSLPTWSTVAQAATVFVRADQVRERSARVLTGEDRDGVHAERRRGVDVHLSKHDVGSRPVPVMNAPLEPMRTAAAG